MIPEEIKKEVIEAQKQQAKRLGLKYAVYEDLAYAPIDSMSFLIQQNIAAVIGKFGEKYCKEKRVEQEKIKFYINQLKYLAAVAGYPFIGNKDVLQLPVYEFIDEEIDKSKVEELFLKIDGMLNPWILSACLYKYFIQIIGKQVREFGFIYQEIDDEIIFSVPLNGMQKYQALYNDLVRLIFNITGCSYEEAKSCFSIDESECIKVKIDCLAFKKIFMQMLQELIVEIDLKQYQQAIQACILQYKLELVSSVVILCSPENFLKMFGDIENDFVKEAVEYFSPNLLNLYEISVSILSILNQQQKLEFMSLLIRTKRTRHLREEDYAEVLAISIRDSIGESSCQNEIKNLIVDFMNSLFSHTKVNIFRKIDKDLLEKIYKIYLSPLFSGFDTPDLINVFDLEKQGIKLSHEVSRARPKLLFLQRNASDIYGELLTSYTAHTIKRLLEGEAKLNYPGLLMLARQLPCNHNSEEPSQVPYIEYLAQEKIKPQKEIFARLVLFYLQTPGSISENDLKKFIDEIPRNGSHRIEHGFFRGKRLMHAIAVSEGVRSLDADVARQAGCGYVRK